MKRKITATGVCPEGVWAESVQEKERTEREEMRERKTERRRQTVEVSGL